MVEVCFQLPPVLKHCGHTVCRAPLGLPGLGAVSVDLPGGLEGPRHASVADQCLEAPRASSAAHQAVQGLHPGQHCLDGNVPGWHLQLDEAAEVSHSPGELGSCMFVCCMSTRLKPSHSRFRVGSCMPSSSLLCI